MKLHHWIEIDLFGREPLNGIGKWIHSRSVTIFFFRLNKSMEIKAISWKRIWRFGLAHLYDWVCNAAEGLIKFRYNLRLQIVVSDSEVISSENELRIFFCLPKINYVNDSAECHSNFHSLFHKCESWHKYVILFFVAQLLKIYNNNNNRYETKKCTHTTESEWPFIRPRSRLMDKYDG